MKIEQFLLQNENKYFDGYRKNCKNPLTFLWEVLKISNTKGIDGAQ